MCSIIGCDHRAIEHLRLGDIRFGYCRYDLPYMNKILYRANIFKGKRKFGIGFRIYELNDRGHKVGVPIINDNSPAS